MNSDNKLIEDCRYGNFEKIKELVESGVDINSFDNIGWTPLIFASYYGHLDVVKYLVERDANVNVKDNTGKTALDYAKEHGDKDIVNYLEKQKNTCKECRRMLKGINSMFENKSSEHHSLCDGKIGSQEIYDNQVCMPINGKVQCIDHCIHQIVAALNAGGIETVASCCGHGNQQGRIDLKDGRVLWIDNEHFEL